jgi:hypothetical protein
MSNSKKSLEIKKLFFYLYVWLSVVIFIIGIFWLATLPSISQSISSDNSTNEIVKTVYRFTLYFLLNLVVYRAFIITLKNTVSRLAFWHSKKEKAEDFEFVLIIEILLVMTSALISIIVALIDELIQLQIFGRTTEIKDLLLSVMGVLCSSVIVYSIPVLGELEVALKHKLSRLFNRKQ